MSKEKTIDLFLGFFGSLFGILFWLYAPMAVPPLALIWLFILPFCVFLTFICIGVVGARKRSKWVPFGVLALLVTWALMGLYQKYRATELVRTLEEQSKTLELDGLPSAFLTGRSSAAWHFPKDHENALLAGLEVFVRHAEGFHHFAIGTGSACDSPKSLRATQEVKHRLPPGKCITVTKVSPETIHAVEFKLEQSEYKESPRRWLKNFGRGFPEFRWSYVSWSVVLHKEGSAHTIANGFTGQTQYPFWLPVAYIHFPNGKNYGRFGWANLYTSKSKIGSGWHLHVFVKKLVEAAGVQSSVVPKTLSKERPIIPTPQKADDLENIRKRLKMLANSPDSDDRLAAAQDVRKWLKRGGDLKDIENILEKLLQYKRQYRKHNLYRALLDYLETTPDWLASLLITVDPNWRIDYLGLLLLKADPRNILMIEKLYGGMFLKKLNQGNISEIKALVLLLPRFSDKSLAKIYSDCTVSNFREINILLKYMNSKYEHERVNYSSKEKQRLVKHTGPCLKHRENWKNFQGRFEKKFGPVPDGPV